MNLSTPQRIWPKLALNLFLVGVLAATWANAAPAADEPQHPNVLLILADDLGYGDIACYNPNSKIKTPNIDRLARDGVRFVDAHSPCTVCTPTRYSLLTGQMAFRIPRGGTVFTGAGGPCLITADRLTLPAMLKSKGYRTACVGKWHVGLTFFDSAGEPIHKGGFEPVKNIDYQRGVAGGPLDRGFDYFFGTACCPTTDWLYAYIDGREIPVPPTQRLNKTGLPKHPYANDNRPGMVADDFDLERVDLKFLEKSQAFLRAHVGTHPEQPFFLFHSLQAVHLPSFPAKEFQGKSGAGPHGDFIVELDYVVGELMKTLEELEVADNTLVLFSSDNGPEVPTVYHMRNDHQHDGAHPWRGVKRDNWEGGHRVPFIIRWPGMSKPGTTNNAIVSQTDVMATIAEIVGYELPDDAAEDSFSMAPSLTGKPPTGPQRDYLLMQGFGGKRYLAIRRGNWKYLAHQGSGGNNYERHRLLQQYKLPNTAPEAPGQLFDLAADPGETTNLFFEQKSRAEELARLLEESKQTGRSRPVGQ